MNEKWTAARIALAIGLFILAGFAEIGGCYLVWKTFRLKQHALYAVAGAVTLFAYGCTFVAMPMDDFGRALAVYGGFFIALSYAFGAVVDGFRPDAGDFIGASIAVVGVLVCMLWPR